MLFKRVPRKMFLTPPKTNSSEFSGQTRLDLQTAQGSVVRSSDETKKESFLAANTLDGFGAHKDKKYPCTI